MKLEGKMLEIVSYQSIEGLIKFWNFFPFWHGFIYSDINKTEDRVYERLRLKKDPMYKREINTDIICPHYYVPCTFECQEHST